MLVDYVYMLCYNYIRGMKNIVCKNGHRRRLYGLW